MAPRNPKIVHLDVASPHLSYLSNVDTSLNWRKLKDVIDKAAGKVVFIETFDAWFGKRVEHAIIQFADADAQDKFLHLPNGWFETHFKGIPKIDILQGEQDRYKFFNKIFTVTGINLLEQGGKPPLSWVEQVKSKHEQRAERRSQQKRRRSASPSPRYNQYQRGEQPQPSSRRGGGRHRPYEQRRQNLTDASLRAMPRDVLYNNQARRAPIQGGGRPYPWDLPGAGDSWAAVDPMLGVIGRQPYNLRPRYNIAPMGMQSQPMSMQYHPQYQPAGYGGLGIQHYNTL